MRVMNTDALSYLKSRRKMYSYGIEKEEEGVSGFMPPATSTLLPLRRFGGWTTWCGGEGYA